MTLPVHLALVSQSNKVTFGDITTCAAAIAKQILRDFTPVWGAQATISAFPDLNHKPADYWPIMIRDDINAPGAAGYHDDSQNQPYALVQSGPGWQLTTSHECLAGSTEIALLRGENIPIRDLVGERAAVYSCKPNGSLRPGWAENIRLTRRDAKVVRVILDNEESVVCTPDHLFMLRDGSYCEARNLTAGTSLMPLYRDRALISPGEPKTKDYEIVFDPALEGWRYTHRMVTPYCSSGYVRHHVDFNRFNNSPDNIQVMKLADHLRLHNEQVAATKPMRGRKALLTEEQRARLREQGRSVLTAYNQSDKHRDDMARYFAEHPEQRVIRGERLRAYATSEAHSQWMRDRMAEPEMKAKSSARITTQNSTPDKRSFLKELWAQPERKEFRARMNQWRWHLYREERGGCLGPDRCAFCAGAERPVLTNHKVLAVEDAGYEDVYDVEVPRYHNFALKAGVFVHNCIEMLVDPTGNRTVAGQSPKPGQGRVLFLVEACDPCEGAQCAYTINGVQVSDFLTPAFFGPTAGACIKLDYSGKLSQPRQVIQDGYLSWLEPASNHWWQQIWFGGDAPQYRDLGVMTGNAGSVREWIDTRTNELSLPRLQASHELLSASSIDTAAADIARAHDIEADVMQFLHG